MKAVLGIDRWQLSAADRIMVTSQVQDRQAYHFGQG
jgi:hypothetical protein